MRKPDFERNTLRILQKGVPERATLFELFMNQRMYERLAGRKASGEDLLSRLSLVAEAFSSAGFDYATTYASSFSFAQNEKTKHATISLNENATIVDWRSFEAYQWNDPLQYDMSHLERIRERMPDGMKLMVMGPGGVLENLIALTGYDNLCIMLYEEPALVKAIADKIGQTLMTYYEAAIAHDTVGFICSNDDWGFNTQTMLSPDDMRKIIFPWHQRIVALAHQHGKPCILHSCGYFDDIIEDVIEDMAFDGRHSYEDTICPVEDAYERLVGRIAVMGGIDMHFMATKTPGEIYARATAMLERSRERGCYFLGTGNSVPEYIPYENYMALVRAAMDFS